MVWPSGQKTCWTGSHINHGFNGIRKTSWMVNPSTVVEKLLLAVCAGQALISIDLCGSSTSCRLILARSTWLKKASVSCTDTASCACSVSLVASDKLSTRFMLRPASRPGRKSQSTWSHRWHGFSMSGSPEVHCFFVLRVTRRTSAFVIHVTSTLILQTAQQRL